MLPLKPLVRLGFYELNTSNMVMPVRGESVLNRLKMRFKGCCLLVIFYEPNFVNPGKSRILFCFWCADRMHT